MIFPGLILAAAVALPPTPAPTAAKTTADEAFVSYRTVKGDNLYTLAERYFTHTSDFAVVQRQNQVKDPRRLPIGVVLRIPRPILKYEPISARVLAYRGDVRIRRGQAEAAAAVDATVGEGDQVVTGVDGFVTLGLPDQSAVALPSQSRVMVRRLRRLLLTGGVERLFELESGRARAIVTPMADPKDDFRLSTPLATSAVRGTEFRMTYVGAGQRATTEVLEGKVEVAAGQTVQLAPAGFGVLASADGAGPPIALLPPPGLAQPGRVQDEDQLVFPITPGAGAAGYRIQIARDAGFLDVVEETGSASPEARLPGIPDGTWFVRVSSIDSNGLEGRTATFGFQRRLNRIETALETRRTGRYREYLFRWRAEGRGLHRFRFQLSGDAEKTLPLIDESGLSDQQFVVTDLPPGAYSWRVMTQQFVDGVMSEKWSPAEQLTISASE